METIGTRRSGVSAFTEQSERGSDASVVVVVAVNTTDRRGGVRVKETGKRSSALFVVAAQRDGSVVGDCVQGRERDRCRGQSGVLHCVVCVCVCA